MSVHDLVSSAVSDDPEAVAEDVARKVLASIESVEDVLPLVVDAVEAEQRRRVRKVEALAQKDWLDAFRPQQSFPVQREQPGVVPDQMRHLLHQRISLGDGRDVTWGRASIADHEQRMAMLEAQRAGITQTIERHRQAVQTLRETGANCLDELVDGSGSEAA